MEKCCAKTLDEIQRAIECFKILSVMLEAAPCVVLAADFPIERDGLIEFVLKETVHHAIETLVKNAPDAKEATAQLTPLQQDTLQRLVGAEIFIHKGGPYYVFWRHANEIYGGGSSK